MSYPRNTAHSIPKDERNLFVTHISNLGPFLCVSGQLNPEAAKGLAPKLLQLLPTCFKLEENWTLERKTAVLKAATVCLYKPIRAPDPMDVDLLRARIMNTYVQQIQSGPLEIAETYVEVEVEFMDYGHSVIVDCHELYFPKNPALFQHTAPYCQRFVMLGVCAQWTRPLLDEIKRMIGHQTLKITIEKEIETYKLVTIQWKDFDLAEFLIHQKKMGAAISNSLLYVNFASFVQELNFQADGGPIPSIGNNMNKYINNDNSNLMAGTCASPAIAGSLIPQRSLDLRLMRQREAAQQALNSGTMSKNGLTSLPFAQPTTSPQKVSSSTVPLTEPTTSPLKDSSTTNHGPPASSQKLTPAATSSVLPTATNGAIAKQVPASRRSAVATFKSNALNEGETYDVCVSFVENGPHHFKVQLLSAQDELTEMMNRIESCQLHRLVDSPTVGMACIAPYFEDNQLYRALIVNVLPPSCKVVYIDYGNTETVGLNTLFEIPEEFLEAPVFAMRFCLSRLRELGTVDDSIKNAFKELVLFKSFQLKVMPFEGTMPIEQYCDLYTKGVSVLDILKKMQKRRTVYPNPLPLLNGEEVEIRYILSPKKFYIQSKKELTTFEKLMEDMFCYYNTNQLVPTKLTLGMPCAVKTGNEWYRAEILRHDETATVVHHVDYGFEQKVTINLLSQMADEHLKFPRQAIQCCLKGFEDKDFIKETTTAQFEMLAEERDDSRRTFKVTVFSINPDGVHIINLTTPQINVMQTLFKYSFPFAQYLAFEKESCLKGPHQNDTHKAINYGQNSLPIASSNEGALTRNKDSNEINQDQQQRYESSKEPQQRQQTRYEPSKEPQQRQQQRYEPAKERQQWRQQLNEPSKESQQRTQKLAARNGNSPPQQSSKDRQVASIESDKPNSVSSWDDEKSVRLNEQKRGGQRTEQYQPQWQKGQGTVQKVPYKAPDTRSVGSANSGGSYNKGRGSDTGSGMRSQRSNQDNENRRNTKQPNSSPRHQQQQRGQRSQNAPQGYVQSYPKSSSQRSDDAKSDWSSNDAGFSPSKGLRSIENYVPLNQPFPIKEIQVPSSEEVLISWWISCHQFYTQPRSRLASLDRLASDMQEFYKNKPLQQLQIKVGSYVVVRNRKTNTMQRGRVLACNQMLRKYKVLLVDYGNHCAVTSEDVWQVEQRFAELPCMAYLCALPNIISNFDHFYVIDHMSQYLPADATLTCVYSKREGEKYYVEVKVNNVSIKKTLISEGVISEVSPDFRLDLLAGQQIRAKISSIKDMLNFKIHFEGCDEHIKLLCSYDDVRFVKSNPDMTPKFKQFYEGKSCMVNIKETDDNKVLLLRPALPLLKEDIPTYICTYPIVLERFVATVVYVASAHRLYAQSEAIEADICALLDDMYAHYEENGEQLSNFETGQICAAQSIDSNWYRARILPFADPNSDSLDVFYLDYGNNETVLKTQLKRLDEKFYLDRSAYAIEINLPLGAEQLKHKNGETVVTELQALTLDKKLTVHALEVHGNHLIADLLTDSQESVVDLLLKKKLVKGRNVDAMRKLLDKEKPNIIEYMEMVDLTLEEEEENDKNQANKSKLATTPIKKKTSVKTTVALEKEVPKAADSVAPIGLEPAVKEVDPSTYVPFEAFEKSFELTTSTPETETATEELFDAYAHMEQATLSHCDNPAQFFVHTMDKLEEVTSLQENLQIVASSLPPLMSIVNGAHCISLYSVDKQWYRAKIMDAELLALKFIDYGNTDCVTDASDIKEMSVFPDMAPLCTTCSLPIKPNGTTDWLDAANNIFTDSYNKVLYLEYLTRGDENDPEKRCFINLYIDGVNVAEKLIKDGFARPLESVISGENCYISHGNSPAEFYIQYEKDAKALELIELYLRDNDLPKVEKFEHLKTVAAYFPEDQMFYRAKMLEEVPEEGVLVFFIDYGNTCVTTECREMSEEIANLSPLSKKCSLELPQGCEYWSEIAEYKFVDMSACGETIFTVELREPTEEYAIVDLFLDGHNIIHDLEPLCVRNANLDDSIDQASIFGIEISSTSISLSDAVYEKGVQYNCTISHSNSLDEFYIQFEKDAESLEKVTNAMGCLTVPLKERNVGQLCAAIYQEDGCYYRARLLEEVPPQIENPTDLYRMFFIDYGNTGISDNLRELPQDLKLLKPLCTRVLWANSHLYEHSMNLAIKCLEEYFEECLGCMKVEIVNSESEPALVKLYDLVTKEELSTVLDKRLDYGIKANVPSTRKEGNECIISHAISPLEFYIQLQPNGTSLALVSKMLSKQEAEQWPLLPNITVDTVGSVYMPMKKCYYRGRVTQVYVDNSFEVKLIDYGKTVIASEMRQLPDELCINIPALAFKCKLSGFPHAETDLVAQKFLDLIKLHDGVVYKIVYHELDDDRSTHTVKLVYDGIDLNDQLSKMLSANNVADDASTKHVELHFGEAAHGFVDNGSVDAVELQTENINPKQTDTDIDCGQQVVKALDNLNTGTEIDEKVAKMMNAINYDTAMSESLMELEPCTVHHVYSPYSFYIVLEKDVGALDFINNVLNETELEPFTAIPTVGAICVALNRKSNAFYRAVIVQVLGNDKYEVQFTDYGNFEITDQLREMPACVAEIPPFCKHVSLDLNNSTYDENGEVFKQIMCSRLDMTFHVSFVDKTKFPMKCNLYFNTENVADELLQSLMVVSEERVLEQTIKMNELKQNMGQTQVPLGTPALRPYMTIPRALHIVRSYHWRLPTSIVNSSSSAWRHPITQQLARVVTIRFLFHQPQQQNVMDSQAIQHSTGSGNNITSGDQIDSLTPSLPD